MRDKTTETEDLVKLKPIMGIRPGVYLTVLYSIILITVLFFLLVFPGLKNPGVVLDIKTEPRGAAIRVNGVYMGTTADKIFVPKGINTLEVVLPGFETESADHEIPGRLFGSRFFPRRYTVRVTLKTGDPAGVLAMAAAEYASWTFGGEPSVAWQIPLSLSEGAYRAGPANDPAAGEILRAASRFAVTRAALRDLVRAKMLLDNGGLSPSPASLIGSVSDILVFLSENPGSAAWLSGLLPPETASTIRNSDWLRNENAAPAPSAADFSGARRLELAGLSFTDIPSGVYLKGFMISENPVPRTVFETFLNENPSWREESLFAQARGNEITEISWFAAEAFCQWLTTRLPLSMADMEVRLPTEAEWEYAAAGMANMGNIWEWCADPFSPLQFIRTDPRTTLAIGSPERSLRTYSLTTETRASLPPDYTSPFVTFRPVIAEKDNGY